jgi:hypothetical protein
MTLFRKLRNSDEDATFKIVDINELVKIHAEVENVRSVILDVNSKFDLLKSNVDTISAEIERLNKHVMERKDDPHLEEKLAQLGGEIVLVKRSQDVFSKFITNKFAEVNESISVLTELYSKNILKN